MLLERILAQEEEKGSRCSRQIIVLGIVVGLVSAAGGGGPKSNLYAPHRSAR